MTIVGDTIKKIEGNLSSDTVDRRVTAGPRVGLRCAKRFAWLPTLCWSMRLNKSHQRGRSHW